ncbi:hypothetical protein ACOME3_004709 [Neoechinorhynchus agilis]
MVMPHPPSLKNDSNKCFVNSSLQALFYNRPLCRWIFAYTEKRCAPMEEGTKFCLKCEMKRIFASMRKARDRPIDAASNLIKQLCRFGNFTFNQQSDANEFMLILLDRTMKSFREYHEQKFCAYWSNGRRGYKLNFDIEYRCPECNEINSGSEESDMVPVFANGQPQHLNHILDEYIGKPNRCDKRCERCGNQMDQIRKIRNTPDSLIFTIFPDIHHLREGHRVTISVRLDLTNFCQGHNVRYHLTSAVLHHSDVTEYGHYTSIVRHDRQSWFTVSDQLVKQLNPGSTSESFKRAYVVIYQIALAKDPEILPKTAVKRKRRASISDGTDSSTNSNRCNEWQYMKSPKRMRGLITRLR